MGESDKKLIPASILKMKDGTFKTTPIQRACTFGASPVLDGSDEGKLGPPTKAIETPTTLLL